MPATLDLPAARRFSEDLNRRILQCDNGEGMECANLESTLNHYADLCHELQTTIAGWANSVFSGETGFDVEVEAVLKNEARVLVARAKQVAAYGRALDAECYKLHALNRLHYLLADLDYLLEHWASPKLAVGPGPRVRTSSGVDREVMACLQGLPPLLADWEPTDPELLAWYRNRKAIVGSGEQ